MNYDVEQPNLVTVISSRKDSATPALFIKRIVVFHAIEFNICILW